NPTAVPTQVVTLRRWDLNAENVRTEPGLIAQLDQALAGVEGSVSIAVKDLGSGRGAVLDGTREMEAASLFKLPILYAVFDAGLPMTEQMVISQQALSYDLGTMELGAGETLSVAEALERMVTISDTTSAIMLGSRVGVARITRDLDALGMDTTHYSLERMTTSAEDMLSLLEAVARGKAVSPSASADMLHLLLRQRVNDRLPRLLPDDAQVAHKTGNLPGIVNDVGILYGPNSTVAIAALISDTSNEAAAASAIARASLVAYTYFEQQPPQNDRPRILPAPTRAIPPVWRQPRPPPPPTAVLTMAPTAVAIVEPTVEPTLAPTVTAVPPLAPTPLPTATPVPTPLRAAPTAVPAQQPTPAPKPAAPTAVPQPPPPTAAAKPAAPTPTPARSR
ncbi:MAG TPA: serine hydrolase, partial [Chloroflexota bacterium]|nr:serine hydrolase [Chloroflexota bacterium]